MHHDRHHLERATHEGVPRAAEEACEGRLTDLPLEVLGSALVHYGYLNPFRAEHICFPEQVAFIRDPARFKTAVCSRRAGKTVSCAVDLLETARAHPDMVSLYLTLVRSNAEKLVWPELLRLNREYALGGVPNYTKLSLTLPNGHVIYCSGAKDKTEIDKFRGLALKKVYIDEAQSMRSHIRELVDDVLSKALFDHGGVLCLIGTPGPVQAGYYYECSHSPKWSNHTWTMLENPHLERKSGRKVMDWIRDDMDRMGVTIDHPKIQRECFGKWAVDSDSLVFKFGPINHLTEIPVNLDEYVIGVDVGFDDSDAICVLGWRRHERKLYLVKEILAQKQDITSLVHQIETLARTYKVHSIVMDTGGLGKKIAEEMRKRFSVPIRAAEKHRKFEFIELLNDAMRTGAFFASPRSRFAEDCNLVEWDRDKSTPDRLVISDRYHTDIGDAVLYAFREALHWLEEPAPIVLKCGTPEWAKDQERQHEEAALEALEARLAEEKVVSQTLEEWNEWL